MTGLISGAIAAAEGLTGLADVREHAGRIARFSPDTAAGSEELKRFLRDTVYSSEALRASRSKSVERIPVLFEFYLEHPERLPSHDRDDASPEPLHRRVCDYIAGMTDGFLLKACRQMGVG